MTASNLILDFKSIRTTAYDANISYFRKLHLKCLENVTVFVIVRHIILPYYLRFKNMITNIHRKFIIDKVNINRENVTTDHVRTAMTYNFLLKGQTDEKLNFALAFCYLHISFTGQNYLRTFGVICVDFLRCANKECNCSYQS